MRLDTERHEPTDPNDLIQYGREDAVRRMGEIARAGASDDDLIHAAKTARNWTEWQGWIAELLEIHS